MGKKCGRNVPSSASRATNQAMSLREEISGKTQADTASLLRVQHLQRLAAWASGEAGVAPIGALLGHRLSANAEADGIPLGASTFLCQRCESVLQPGFNCTIRLKNNKRKGKRRKKSNSSQNRVAYACHFCGDQNLITGAGKGIVKALLSSRKSATTDTISKRSKGDSRNRATVDTKEGLEHSLAAVSLAKSSSMLKPLTVEKDEHMNVPKSNVREDSKMGERVVSSTCRLAAATIQEDIAKEIVAESTNDKCMSEIELASSEKTRLCEPKVTLQAEFPAESKFVTQKNKLTNATNLKGSAELLKTRSTQNKKGESSGSVSGKAPTSSIKSSGPGKKTKSAPSDSAQVAGGSRKRARKGWTTLKQIAEKDKLERKEKMGRKKLCLLSKRLSLKSELPEMNRTSDEAYKPPDCSQKDGKLIELPLSAPVPRSQIIGLGVVSQRSVSQSYCSIKQNRTSMTNVVCDSEDSTDECEIINRGIVDSHKNVNRSNCSIKQSGTPVENVVSDSEDSADERVRPSRSRLSLMRRRLAGETTAAKDK